MVVSCSAMLVAAHGQTVGMETALGASRATGRPSAVGAAAEAAAVGTVHRAAAPLVPLALALASALILPGCRIRPLAAFAAADGSESAGRDSVQCVQVWVPSGAGWYSTASMPPHPGVRTYCALVTMRRALQCPSGFTGGNPCLVCALARISAPPRRRPTRSPTVRLATTWTQRCASGGWALRLGGGGRTALTASRLTMRQPQRGSQTRLDSIDLSKMPRSTQKNRNRG